MMSFILSPSNRCVGIYEVCLRKITNKTQGEMTALNMAP